MKELLDVDDIQADAILAMQLRRLAALERQKIVDELAEIEEEIADLKHILAHEERQRQIVHDTGTIGLPKVASAEARLKAINPDIRLETQRTRLTAANVMGLIADYDVVADGTDNFATRFLLADACHLGQRTLVSAAMLRFDGQLSTFKSHLGGPNPCYRCIFREPPPRGLIPSCAEAGVLGALAGAVGSIQAIEVIKEVLGIGESLSGNLLMYDALSTSFHKVRVKPDPECPLCGSHPTITDLAAHGIAS